MRKGEKRDREKERRGEEGGREGGREGRGGRGGGRVKEYIASTSTFFTLSFAGCMFHNLW